MLPFPARACKWAKSMQGFTPGISLLIARVKNNVRGASQVAIMSGIHQPLTRFWPFFIRGIQIDKIRRVHADRYFIFTASRPNGSAGFLGYAYRLDPAKFQCAQT